MGSRVTLHCSVQNNTVLACSEVRIVSANPYNSKEHEIKNAFEVINLVFEKSIKLHRM